MVYAISFQKINEYILKDANLGKLTVQNVENAYFSLHPLQPILWCYDSFLLHIISSEKCVRELIIGTFGIPLHLKDGELPIALLYVIYLLPLVGTPEITIHVPTAILICLDTLADEEILPQSTHILAKSKRREVLQNGIADAIIVKIEFLGSLQLRAKITTESIEFKDNIAFFQQVNVLL